MTRGDVLKEFGFVRHNGPMGYDDMADEIVRLRRWNAARKRLLRDYKRNAERHSQAIGDLSEKKTWLHDEVEALENRLASWKISKEALYRKFVAVEAERDALRGQLADYSLQCANEMAKVMAERDALDRTIAALREPSEAVLDAAGDAYTDVLEGSEEGQRLLHALADSNSYAAICDYEWVRVAIRAAVAAAEKEVGQ